MTTLAQTNTSGMPSHPKPGKSNAHMIAVKGPEVLTAAQIKDIVESRPNVGARKAMSDKYGISITRVTHIWKQYYGGGSLKDYQTGLKMPLPKSDMRTADINTRKFRTERGVYSAREPKVVAQADQNNKAASVRKLLPVRKVAGGSNATDLDLDDVDSMGDREAQIMAGEVRAGNDNEELLSAIYEMLDHNQNISDRAISALENALKVVSSRKARNNSVETEDDDSNIYTDNDDSTVIYKKKTQPTEKHNRNGGSRYDKNRMESTESDTGGDLEYSPAVLLDKGSTSGLVGSHNVDPRIREISPRSGARAQPIYRTERASAIQQPIQANSGQIVGPQSALPPAEYNAGERDIQPHYALNNSQQHSRPEQGHQLYWNGGNRPSQIIPGLSWLKPRPG